MDESLSFTNENIRLFLPVHLPLSGFTRGAAAFTDSTCDITGHFSAYESKDGPAFRTNDAGTRFKNGHFLAKSILNFRQMRV